jgi:AcrR family transcriptional regulator
MAGQMTDDFELSPADWLPIGGTALQCRLGEAAIELFYSRGALATTVREITGACGLTQGALCDRRQEVRAIRRQIRDRLSGILLAGAEQGEFDLAGGNDLQSATLASATISTMCVHISDWTLDHYPLDLADLQHRYVIMALRIAGASL